MNTKELDNIWSVIGDRNKVEIIIAVLKDEIVELKKNASVTTNNNLSELITILEKRITELEPHAHRVTRPFNGNPQA